MILRALLFCALVPLSALAQIQVYLFDGANETPAGALVNVGAASPGDTVETRFRVRNAGTTPATVQTLSLAGAGFSLSATPSLPFTVAPYTGSPASEVEFRVTFHPTEVASYSGLLLVNAITVSLQGTVAPSAVLTLAGSNTPLSAGAIIDFGPVASGTSKLLTFNLSNPSGSAVTVSQLSVTGNTAFKRPIGISVPISLAQGQTVSFQIEFQPTPGQASQGALGVDQRSFVLTGSALAQIQVYLFDGTNETPVGALVDVGTASPGDTVETRFRVRNIGTGPAVFQTLALSGSGFSISAAPSLPFTIAPYTGSPASEAEFRVTFNPTDVVTYSAFLLVNTINVILQGAGTPSAVVTLAGSNIPLAAGAIIDFGAVASGASKLLTFKLSNPAGSSVKVSTLSVTGAGFKGPIGASAPISLAPGQTVTFDVAFQPVSGQASEATLVVDQRSFVLTGQGLNPPLPGASFVFGSSTGLSAQQNNVSIPLATASKVSGTGTLTMTFQSSVQSVTNDPAIQFLSGPTRHATVTISVGDTTAKFDGNQSDLVFQTGTTAGTITFTLTLDGGVTTATEATLTIAPAPVNFQTATSVRRLGALDVSITAFDNTYSASELAFTFFDKSGATMQPGVIRVDATSDFRLYFGSTVAGGAFALLATFPVTGDVSQIAGTTVAITNSVGATTTQRIVIGN